MDDRCLCGMHTKAKAAFANHNCRVKRPHFVRLATEQPPDFGWGSFLNKVEMRRSLELWFWYNGQGGWTAEFNAFPEGAD